MILAQFLLFSCVPFVIVTLFFGTKGGYYDTDQYDGDGTVQGVEVIRDSNPVKSSVYPNGQTDGKLTHRQEQGLY